MRFCSSGLHASPLAGEYGIRVCCKFEAEHAEAISPTAALPVLMDERAELICEEGGVETLAGAREEVRESATKPSCAAAAVALAKIIAKINV